MFRVLKALLYTLIFLVSIALSIGLAYLAAIVIIPFMFAHTIFCVIIMFAIILFRWIYEELGDDE